MYLRADGISRAELREIAFQFRKKFQCDNILIFPILDIIDQLVDLDLLSFQIVEDNNEIFQKNEIARYSLGDNTIYVTESVYIECINGVGRSRYTITHELAHYILNKLVGLTVIQEEDKPKSYEDPEWQADTLCAELLVPFEMTEGFTVMELIEKCNISEECAIVTYNKRNKIWSFDYKEKQ